MKSFSISDVTLTESSSLIQPMLARYIFALDTFQVKGYNCCSSKYTLKQCYVCMTDSDVEALFLGRTV